MLTVETRAQLLADAAQLSAVSDFARICELLCPIGPAEILQEPDLAMDLANALYRTDRLDDAWQLLALISDACIRRKTDRVYRRWVNLSGVLHVEFGNLTKAEAAFIETLSCSSDASDSSMLAAATFNLGSIAWVRCEWASALASFQRARTSYSSLGRLYSVAGCHLNIAMTYREMLFFGEADSHFELALDAYASDNCDRSSEISAVEAERALLINAMSDAGSAEVVVRRAIGRITSSGQLRTFGEAYKVLGIVLSAQNRPDEAVECHVRAIRAAKKVRNPLLEAEICEELGKLLGSVRGRRFTTRAAQLYVKIGAVLRAARVG